jgi:endonuclease IV
MSKTNTKEIENLNEKVNKLAEKTDKTLGKVTIQEENLEEFTEMELEYLDRYTNITEGSLNDDELYEIFLKYNFDDHKINKEITEYMKLVKKRGDDYIWTKIENGKSI